MSRINEALRRVEGTGPKPEPVAGSQHLFTSPWSVAGRDESEAEPVPATTEALAPSSGQPPALTTAQGLSSDLGPAITTPLGLKGFASRWRECLATPPHGDPALIEQFRRLAGTLHHAQHTSGLRTLMVTSAAPGDGKTLTAINLALVLAESYRGNVLLIDADLRRPSIPGWVEGSTGCGLSEALRAPTEQKLALLALTPRLTLLPAGQPIANSLEALTSPRMQQILAQASTRFDWVILDAPPVGPTADARLLTGMVGGTLFVVRAGKTQCPELEKAIDSIGREQILGVVLNGVDPEPHDGYYGIARPGE